MITGRPEPMADDPDGHEAAITTTTTLSDGQLLALRNLARKQAGEDVDWIKIADARSLTELGFAERGREGWTITPAGLAALAALGGAPPTPSGPTPLPTNRHSW